MTKIYLPLLFAMTLMLSASVSAQQETVELGNGAKIVSKSFEEKNEKRSMEISAEYPEIHGLNSNAVRQFNVIAKSLAMKEVEEFKKSLGELEEQQPKLVEERQTGNYLELGFSVAFASEYLISISFGTSRYAGGAHPNANSFSLNFDLKSGKRLDIAELFLENSDYLAAISQISVASLEKDFQSPGDEWIMRGAGPKKENFRSWTISKDGLAIQFDQYQVASYVDGPQEALIPFSALRDYLRVFYVEPLRYANFGNSVNMCRNGAFPSDSDDFRLARVRGKANLKAFFYSDEKDICPGNESCKTKRYIIPNDEIIVSRVYGNYACAWFQPKNGSETVGWISLNDLDFVERTSWRYEWLGTWNFYDNSINIKSGKEGISLSFTGNAFWKGLGDNIHIGEIDFSGIPEQNKIELGENGEYECRVKMQRLSDYLIVSDNRNCGGANVTFNGIYRR